MRQHIFKCHFNYYIWKETLIYFKNFIKIILIDYILSWFNFDIFEIEMLIPVIPFSLFKKINVDNNSAIYLNLIIIGTNIKLEQSVNRHYYLTY